MSSNELDDMRQEMSRSGERMYAVLLAVLRQVAEARTERLRRTEAHALAELRERKPSPQSRQWAADVKGWVAANMDADPARAEAWDKHVRERWGIDPDAARVDARTLGKEYRGNGGKLRADVAGMAGEDFVRDLEDAHSTGVDTGTDEQTTETVEKADERAPQPVEKHVQRSTLKPGEAWGVAVAEHHARSQQKNQQNNGVWQNGSESARLAGAGFDTVLGTHGQGEESDLPNVPRKIKLPAKALKAGRGNRAQENINDLGR